MAFPNQIVSTSGDLVIPSLRSEDYVEGESGWRFAREGSAQVQDLSVVNEVGATHGNFEMLEINGQDFTTEILPSISSGVVSMDWNPSRGNTANSGLTETKHFEYAYGPLIDGRLYRIIVHGLVLYTIQEQASYDVLIRYTTNGSAPTTSSPELPGSAYRVYIDSLSRAGQFVIICYANMGDVSNLRMALTLRKLYGNGVASFYADNNNRRIEWSIEDCGPRSVSYAGTLAQKTFYTPPVNDPPAPPPDPDPVRRYTANFYATWSRSYDGDGSTRSPDTNEMYQGYYSGTHGRTKSLAGFNYDDIMSALSGASIVSCKLTFKVAYRAWSNGLDVQIDCHDYTSKPGSWDSSRVDSNVRSRANCNQGSTYTVDMGTTTGGKFKSGAFKGIGFSAAHNGNDAYGRLYGINGTKPKLTFVYDK